MKINVVNIFEKTISQAELHIADGFIKEINITGPENPLLHYAMPGFTDAHVHIESSMLTPAQFARLAVVHGTVSTVSDPHEIGNVLGMEGVEFMINDGKRVPFKFCLGAPSCVPATIFETAGAVINAEQVGQLLASGDIGYLAEVMNFPGVINEDPDMIAKIKWAKHYNKVIDGHAPGLRGEAAKKYASHGISTDHECFTYDEAKEKIGYGVKILIREGSAARNFDALIPLIAEFPEKIMFCSDDKHPDSLVAGHINVLVKRALALGYDIWDILLAACVNPVLHYSLPVGLLRKGDPADFIIVDNLHALNVLETWIDGALVAKDTVSLIPDLRSAHPNQFVCEPKTPLDFICKNEKKSETQIRVIEALEGQLITNEIMTHAKQEGDVILADPDHDILKITVINRYENTHPAVAFIKNFGLKRGAIASSVGHDSHNIICVGCDDESIAIAVNMIIEAKGGISAVGNEKRHLIPLPIAGIMTDMDGYAVAASYTSLDNFVKEELQSALQSPFMTLSFMALLVIPSLKLSDKGLFDGVNFRFVSLSL
ncbi:adenine deaminase [Dyadobacter fanqingshengii]|uniref:Adenine deaminase n=1 Tax=Dyadobacter fanqingshengii TaxID=2906443 RepID=A0A9X1PEK0_9BACT|nr:adenine deaminase [Dyadobacter fanqingshengii]MCF0042674.1 adenine deaminase [Dyadobacter fanqingshengii]USJ36101.1 adenine deaminase [Dyadobacter fanqingshengii]